MTIYTLSRSRAVPHTRSQAWTSAANPRPKAFDDRAAALVRENETLLRRALDARRALTDAVVPFLLALAKGLRNEAQQGLPDSDRRLRFVDDSQLHSLVAHMLGDAEAAVVNELGEQLMSCLSDLTDRTVGSGDDQPATPVYSSQAHGMRPHASRLPSLADHAWRSAVAHEVEGLSREQQALYESQYEPAMRSARVRARREGLSEAETTEVEQAAEHALQTAAANYRGDHASHATFRTFLYAGLNPSITRAIQRVRRRRATLDEDFEVVADSPGVADQLSEREMREVLADLVRRLPAMQKKVVEEYHGLGGRASKSLADLAREMGLNAVTVRNYHVEALRRLRAMLQDRGLELAAFVGSSGLLRLGRL